MEENKNVELNMEEMDEVSGGKRVAGGSKNPLAPKAGYVVYQILPNDNLTKIATKYHTTVAKIMSANPSIKDKNLIRAGFYIYVPQN